MNTRTRQTTKQDESRLDEFEGPLDLETFSEDELEEFLFDDEQEKKKGGLFNLPSMAGLSMIVVGIIYLLQQMGVFAGAGAIASLVPLLPWLAGILIILLGFGVLSWRPKKKKRVATRTTSKERVVRESATSHTKKRLVKSSDKKIAGVCGGIANYFNIDPTLVRIAFVIGTIIGQGTFVVAYIVLAMIMGKADPMVPVKSGKLTDEERITIIRDS
jgi:phage shock protein C